MSPRRVCSVPPLALQLQPSWPLCHVVARFVVCGVPLHMFRVPGISSFFRSPLQFCLHSHSFMQQVLGDYPQAFWLDHTLTFQVFLWSLSGSLYNSCIVHAVYRVSINSSMPESASYSDSNQDHGCHELLRFLVDILNDTFFLFFFICVCICVNKYTFSQSRVAWALSGKFLRYLQCIFPVVLNKLVAFCLVVLVF